MHLPRNLGSEHQPQQANISSSTVVAIGCGFISFALLVVVCLTSIRIHRLRKEAVRRRAAGEHVTFRELWNRDGGFWGFFTGSSIDRTIIGAGGRVMSRVEMIQQMRLAELMRERDERERQAIRNKPKMCEVEVPEKGGMGAKDFDYDYFPLGLQADSQWLALDQVPMDAPLNCSVLIMLPSPIQDEQTRGRNRRVSLDEDYDDLPEMIIGSTHLKPFICSPSPESSRDSLEKVEQAVDKVVADRIAVVEVSEGESDRRKKGKSTR